MQRQRPGWSYEAASRRMLRTARSHQKLRENHSLIFSQRPRRDQPGQHIDFALLCPPEMWGNIFLLFQATKFAIFVTVCACLGASQVVPVDQASLVALLVKIPPAMQETWSWSLGGEDPREKEMATHSSILAWKVPWTEEPGRIQSMGSQRVRHDWATSLHPLLIVLIVEKSFRFLVVFMVEQTLGVPYSTISSDVITYQ